MINSNEEEIKNTKEKFENISQNTEKSILEGEERKSKNNAALDKIILNEINGNQSNTKKLVPIFVSVLVAVLLLVAVMIVINNRNSFVPTDSDYTVKANNSTQEDKNTTLSVENTETLYTTTMTTEVETVTEDTTEFIDKEDWKLILVNNENPLPEGFSIETTALKNGKEVDSRMYPYLNQMLTDANSQGINIFVCSAYRTYEYQKGLFDRQQKIYMDSGMSEEDAYNLTKREIAIPGTSEHSSGLAVDIVAVEYQMLDEGFAKTDAFKWLSENAEKYGFILRYPEDKEPITGIKYESWHYRYVGEENAKKINELGVCLEEYLMQ